MSKRTQPSWSLPSGDVSPPKLELFNSLTRSKCEFVSLSGGSRVTWYNCGPTVYDSSHMGHARSYISFDIIRRVLTNYFNYDVFFVQNVTDIDDKIIRRARQHHLYQEYVSQMSADNDKTKLIQDLTQALNQMKERQEAETDVDKKSMLAKLISNGEQLTTQPDIEVTQMLEQSKDVLSDWLDRKKGDSVTDNSIFTSLPRKYENDYNEDMKNLNVLAPDVVTRVSEYVPEIVAYIERIIENGYAYEANGSVYFDTEKFSKDKKHFYAKLVPEAFGDSKALAEGEGDLFQSGEKRNANDFALWKCSKPGEPWWDSVWGHGRPGWHIECSVMASEILGTQMDIHSGGVDLKFPHHDNEMAQAEAYFDTGKPWINYFIHSGHLTISGCKMSKSLKNFISIKDALKKHTSRQLRLAFLLHSWKDTLDYGCNTMSDAIQYEKMVNEFFLTVKDLLRESCKLENAFMKWSQSEIELNNRFHESISNIHLSLCDNIDTRSACEEIRRLIASANTYIQAGLQSSKIPNPILLKNIAIYVTNLFRVFGASDVTQDSIGFGSQSSQGGANKEEIVMPFLDVIANLREKVRQKAKELKNAELMVICDEIRNDIMPELGVRMEDTDLGEGRMKTCLKLVDKETLMREKEMKLQLEEKKRQEKEKKRLEKELLDKQREAQKRIAPNELFISETDKYSLFDDKGIPTHDVEGKELSKGQRKKLEKLYQAQEKKYEEFMKTNKVTNGQA